MWEIASWGIDNLPQSLESFYSAGRGFRAAPVFCAQAGSVSWLGVEVFGNRRQRQLEGLVACRGVALIDAAPFQPPACCETIDPWWGRGLAE